MTQDAPAAMRSRFIPLALTLVGAVAFALALQAAWWTAGEVSIGPFGSRHCFGGECRETGLAWIGGTELWMRAGVATRAGGYIAMFVLVIVAGAVAAKRVPRLMARASLVAILTATAAGAYFLFAFPGIAQAAMGPGVFLFIGGIVLGVAGSILALRLP